jgi:flagellar motor switch protein FliM
MTMAQDPDLPAGAMLDQSEIDRLIATATATAKPALLRADGRRDTETDAARVEPCDFRNPAFLTEAELRRLRILHEDFIRYLSARLALILRMECVLKMTRLTTLTYSRFAENLPSPAHICLFKAEPLLGVGVLDLNPRLALTLVDRMLGGRGHSVKTERYLTEIETALLEDILNVVLEEWCVQWKGGPELHPQIIGHESNGRYLQTSPRDAVVLALSVEFSFGDCSEMMQIGVPYYTIEPLVKAVESRRHKQSEAPVPALPPAWRSIYEQVKIPVRAEWVRADLPLREVAALQVGDILELPVGVLDETNILLSGTPKFGGTVGLDGDRVAVTIKRKLPRADATRPSSHGSHHA